MSKSKNISKAALQEQIKRLNAEIEQLKLEMTNPSDLPKEMSFHSVAANIPDFVCIHDLEGNVEYINPAGIKLLNYKSAKELIGNSVLLFTPKETLDEIYKRKASRDRGDLSSNKYETKIITKDQIEIPVEVHSSTMRHNNATKIILFVHDISERVLREHTIKEQSEQFRIYFEQSPLSVFHYDKNGIILDCNEEFLSKNNLKRENFIGKNAFKILNNKDLVNKLKEALIHGETNYTGVFSKDKNKKPYYIKIYLKGVKDENGQINSVVGLVENINEQIKNQHEIEKAQKNLMRAQRIANIGNWEFNLNTGEVYTSRGAKIIYGLSDASYSIKEVQEISLPQYRALLDNELKMLIESGNPYDIEFKIKRVNDGQLRDIQSLAEYDKENNIVFGVIRDITSSKKRRIAIKESEERFKTLFYENSSVMLLMDPNDGRIIDANIAAEQFYKCTSNELQKKYIQDINTSTNPEIQNAIEHAKLGNKNVFQFKHKLATGEIRDVEVFSGLVKLNNRPLLYSTVHDITQRQQALLELKDNEERLRLALHASQQGLWDVNLIDLSMQVSPEYATMLGYSPDGYEMTLKKWEHIIHPDDRQATTKKFYGYMHGLYPDYQMEFRLKTKSGNYKWIMSIGKIIAWDKNGKASRMIGIHTDISHIKEVEFELLEAKEKAEESNRLKTAFLQNMSHEIRTPMNGIMGFSDLLIDEELTLEDRIDYAQIIHRNSYQLLRIVNDILDISRLDSGQLQIEKSNFNLLDLLHAQSRFYSPQIEQKGLDFRFDNYFVNKQKIIIKSDQTRIKQILDNLLNNALKFTETGHIFLVLKDDPEYYIVQVDDSGLGIQKQKIKRIFNRFEQSHTDKIPGGAGLGLAISNELAKLLKGKLIVDSELGKGSTFSLYLPKQSSF